MTVLRYQTPQGTPIILNTRPESTVIMQNGDTSFTFDYEGRLVGAFLNGRNYRRSLANQVLEKQAGPRPGLSGRLRRMLQPAEVQELEDRAYRFAREQASYLPQDGESVEKAHAALARIGRYDYARLEQERVAFERIYHPVTILPPDQYLALYLQATEGCSYNRCQFCGFYRDRRFRIKSLDEFRAHIRAVREFLGGGLSLRRSIFLGDANALTIPSSRLLPLFDVICDEFAILPVTLDKDGRRRWKAEHPLHFDGIYSFVDAFSMHQKTPALYAELAARGLRRVYVGLESGDPELLRFLGKPNTPGDVVELVQDLKAGGVAVGVIILAGAGGERYAEAHVRETANVVNAMPLDARDLIYFSELVDYPGSSYSQLAREAQIRPLDSVEIEGQMAALRGLFRFRPGAHAPKISYYDVREFVY